MKENKCKTNLTPTIISEEVFKREVELCNKLNRENCGKCCWGICKNCGVIPLLHKLNNGEVIDNENEVVKLKEKFLK